MTCTDLHTSSFGICLFDPHLSAPDNRLLSAAGMLFHRLTEYTASSTISAGIIH